MFGLGFSELLLIMVVVLIVFGPEKLPEIARNLGRASGQFRRAMDEFKFEINSANFDRELNSQQNLQQPASAAPQLSGNSSSQANPTVSGNLEYGGSAIYSDPSQPNEVQRFGCEVVQTGNSPIADPAGPLPSAMPEAPIKTQSANQPATAPSAPASQAASAASEESSKNSSFSGLASSDPAATAPKGSDAPTNENS